MISLSILKQQNLINHVRYIRPVFREVAGKL